MRTAQMFFEDCEGTSKGAIKLNQTFKVSEVFLSLSFYFWGLSSVLVLCCVV